MIRRFLFLAALAASAPSWSAVTLSNFPPNPGVLPGGGWQFTSGTTFGNPTSPRAWVNGVYGGVPSAVATDSLTVTGRAGLLALQARSTVTAAEVAMGLARAAGRAYLPITIGMAAYDLLASSGVRQGSAGAEMDAGSAPSARDVFSVSGKTGTSKVSACEAYTKSVYIGQYQYFQDGFPINAVYQPRGYVGLQGQTEVCIVDGFNHLNQLTQPGFRVENFSTTTENTGCTEAATGAPMQMRADGKCPTGRYESATVAQVAAAVRPVVDADVSNAAKAAVDAGAKLDTSGFSSSGPASQIGTPNTTTTTGPGGQVSTTTTPTYNYTYGGTTVTQTITNVVVTTTTNVAGDVTTTTTTSEKPPADPAGCEQFPDTLGCVKLGDVPDAEPVPINRLPVTITKDLRWGANSGGCTRAAIQLVSGPTIDLWKPFCDFFGLIRGVVVGMFGLVGAFIFRNGVK